MPTSSFAIEFNFSEDYREDAAFCSNAVKYRASITTLSKTFKLFKVSSIKKMSNGELVELPEHYHITRHPLNNEKNEAWKDPVTMHSNDFLQAIGNAIEAHLLSLELHEQILLN